MLQIFWFCHDVLQWNTTQKFNLNCIDDHLQIKPSVKIVNSVSSSDASRTHVKIKDGCVFPLQQPR